MRSVKQISWKFKCESLSHSSKHFACFSSISILNVQYSIGKRLTLFALISSEYFRIWSVLITVIEAKFLSRSYSRLDLLVERFPHLSWSRWKMRQLVSSCHMISWRINLLSIHFHWWNSDAKKQHLFNRNRFSTRTPFSMTLKRDLRQWNALKHFELDFN